MVIKKKPGVEIKNEIGHLFKTHNIIEYKSPDDQFNIDNYYKSIAYACLYKAQSEYVNEIPIEEVTLSLFYDSKPVRLMNILEQSGHRIIEKYKGIYYIEGDLTLPRKQIIVTEEFEGSHCFLKALSRKFTVEDGIELINFADSSLSKGDKEKLDSVLQVSFIANNNVYNRIKKENTMCEAFFELFKDEIDAKIAAAELLAREEGMEKGREEGREESKAIIQALEREIAELKKKIAN